MDISLPGATSGRPIDGRRAVTFIALCLLLAVLAPPRALALPGEHNELPELCQGVAGAAYVVNQLGAIVTPAPGNKLFDRLAYAANLNLKLCPPQIVAPPPIYGVAADSDDECVATFFQPYTEGEYENILGVPIRLKYPSDWGDLGTPDTYHFNTDVRVDLPGFEPRAGFVEIPVGRNNLQWRANTLVTVMDFVDLPMPPFVNGSEAKEQLIKRTPPLRAAVRSGYRAYARSLGKNVAEFVYEEGTDYLLNDVIDLFIDSGFTLGQFGLFDDADNYDSQAVWVIDRVPPVISTNTDNDSFSPELAAILNYRVAPGAYILEAFQPGGVSAERAVDIARDLLSYSDACDTRLSLSHSAVPELWATGDEVSVTWTVRDPGPARAPVLVGGVPQDDGGRNSATVTQTFRIRDTNPPILLAPPSRVVEVAAGSVDVDLGSPRVFDLADLDPEIGNDHDGSPFALGLHEITWTATDLGNNTSTAVQLVNIKQVGANTAPDADGSTVAATSFQPVDIVLTAFDADFHPSVGRYDPLTFSIVEPPANGFFVAPLLPFFIEDFRLEAATVDYVYEPAPATEAERWGSLQADPELACEANLDSLPLPGLVSRWDLEYPYLPTWMTVDDAGNTYVYDRGRLRCDANNDDIRTARIVSFDADGELIQARSMTDSVDDFSVDNFTGRLLTLDRKGPWDNYINAFVRDQPNFGVPDGETPSGLRVRDVDFGMQTARALVQDHQGVLYVQGSPDIIRAYRPDWGIYGTSQDDVDVYLATVPNVPRDPGVFDITVDSQNNLYMIHWNRIYKFGAGVFDEDDNFTPPQLLGWMGRCTRNLTNAVACDVNNQRSIGFACSDALCGVESDTPTNGDYRGPEPGQFAGPQAIVVDPNDILYVGDAGNDRIQRFTPEGYFAGQAKAQGVGWGFILGDFGQFDKISVNSDHFYLLQEDDPLGGAQGLLHVFKTTPITPLDDASAKVTYQSNNNFVGTDRFVFGVTDGLDGDQASVLVNVERDFRPPTIPLPPGDQFVDEDGELVIVLSASDPDEDLDVISFEIDQPPSSGSVEIVGDRLTYTPNPNYAGADSFSYVAFDGLFYSAAQTVAVTVDPVPDRPEVIVTAPARGGVGFEVSVEITVFDPDEDPEHDIFILWGDGSDTRNGQILVDGVAVDEVTFDADGKLPENLDTSGPIYTRGDNGYGTLTAEHAYAEAGNYQILVFVNDDQPVSTSEGSAEVAISRRAALTLDTETNVDTIDPGTSFRLTVDVVNRPFDVAPTDGTAGRAARDLVVTGTLAPLLRNARHSPVHGGPECRFERDTFSCPIGDLAYDDSARLEFIVDVDPLAPGLARLAVGLEADSVTPTHEEARGAAQVEVNAGSERPRLDSLTPNRGGTTAGTEVTLIGDRFQAGAAVYFGSRLASLVDVVDARTITALAPIQRAGEVDVVVINPDQRRDTLPAAFAYRDAPPPGDDDDDGGGSGGSGVAAGLLASLLLLLGLRRARAGPRWNSAGGRL